MLQYGKRPFHLSVRNGHLSTAVQLVLASEKVEDLTVEVCDSQLC